VTSDILERDQFQFKEALEEMKNKKNSPKKKLLLEAI
jgi:hypothetical protein